MNPRGIPTLLLGILVPAGLLASCGMGSVSPRIAEATPRGSVRFETGERFRQERSVRGDTPLRAIDCQHATLAFLQDDGLFLLNADDLAERAKRRVVPARDLALSADQVFLLSESGELVLLAPLDDDPGARTAWPLPDATCLAAGPRLLAAGFEDGAVQLLRPPSFGTERLDRAATLDLGSSGVKALSFGEGEASRYLYAGLEGEPWLVVIDMENPAGPTVCNRIEAPPPRSLSSSGMALLLTPENDRVEGPLVYDLLDPALPRLDAQLPFRGAFAVERTGGRLFVLDGAQVISTYRLIPVEASLKP